MSEDTERRAKLPPRPTIRESGIIIDPAFRGGLGIGSNPAPRSELDKAIAEDERLEAQDIRRLRAKEIEARMKARIADLEKQAGTSQGGQFNKQAFEITPAMAQMIADQPPDKREEVLRVYTTLIAATKSAPNDYGQMLIPMLMGFQRSNPEAGPNAMAAYAKGVSDQIISGIQLGSQLATQGKPQQSALGEAAQLLEVFSKMYQNSMMTPIQQLIQEMKPQASVFEQILLNPEIFAKAQQIGMFGGGGSSNVQLEQFRNENNFRLEQLRMEDRRWQAQFNAEQVGGQQRLQAVTQIMSGPLAGILSALGDVTRTRVGGTGQPAPAAAHGGQGQPVPAATPALKPMPGLELMNCPVEGCGGQFYVNDGQMRFECPHCHTLLADKEEMMGRAAEENIEVEPPEHVPPKPAPAQTQLPAAPAKGQPLPPKPRQTGREEVVEPDERVQQQGQEQAEPPQQRTTATDEEQEERVQGTGAPE